MSVKSGALFYITLVQVLVLSTPLFATDVLVEAEGFEKLGGWVIDPQFMDVMRSSYLLAHGLGKPVESARTEHALAEGRTYHVWVRAKDWVPSHHPGRFRVLINGHALPVELGANGQDWNWEPCGSVELARGQVTIELKDLTGFDGRCDAIFFTTDVRNKPPTQPNEKMQAWRRRLLGLLAEPVVAGEFDVVVVGGGIAGCSAALTANRLGLKAALVHDRPVLGDNSSSECGISPYPKKRNHPLVEEVIQQRHSPEAFSGEPNLSLYLGWRAFGVDRQPPAHQRPSHQAQGRTSGQAHRAGGYRTVLEARSELRRPLRVWNQRRPLALLPGQDHHGRRRNHHRASDDTITMQREARPRVAAMKVLFMRPVPCNWLLTCLETDIMPESPSIEQPHSKRGISEGEIQRGIQGATDSMFVRSLVIPAQKAQKRSQEYVSFLAGHDNIYLKDVKRSWRI